MQKEGWDAKEKDGLGRLIYGGLTKKEAVQGFEGVDLRANIILPPAEGRTESTETETVWLRRCRASATTTMEPSGR